MKPIELHQGKIRAVHLGLAGLVLGVSVFFTTPAMATDYYSGHRWFWTSNDICYDGYSLDTIYIDGGTNKVSTVTSELDQARNSWNNQSSQFTINKVSSCNHWVTAANYGSSGSIATTYTQYDFWGYISDSDIEFNNYLEFSTTNSCSEPYTMDYVQRHELGHWAGFSHSSQSATSVMVPTYDCNKLNSIKTHDASSLYDVYG